MCSFFTDRDHSLSLYGIGRDRGNLGESTGAQAFPECLCAAGLAAAPF
jgi:hypothetical protein